ncbi:uncharacterized protein CDV56_104019 [Aspergillus thermomutatus]|uniref:Uncharacterized protein n=1 Tax=Aspergillus thermomutatus TaxID=41047 RepID=A0A397GXE2_ASPTH|nr:uncharacterized protein CDV56_104019 [Aspergillus thermomutatus]RHZ55651.1 hypothetical protein CDV56_104019 [Aspergillus thermomutatus]
MDCSPSPPRPQSPPLSPPPRRSRRRRRFSDPFARGHGYNADRDHSYPLERVQSHGQGHSDNHDQSQENDAPPAKKTVRWGPVTEIESYARPDSADAVPPSSCGVAVKSCLKPPTASDQEMVQRNLRAMVDESTKRLDMYYDAMEYFSGDVVLDEVMCQDEGHLFQKARRQSLKDTFGFVRSRSHSPSRSSSRKSL